MGGGKKNNGGVITHPRLRKKHWGGNKNPPLFNSKKFSVNP